MTSFFVAFVVGVPGAAVAGEDPVFEFEAAQALPGPVNSPDNDERPRELTADGLTLLLSRRGVGGAGSSHYETLWSVRPDLSSDFAAPIEIPGVNTSVHDEEPTLSADGLEVYWGHSEGPIGRWDIRVATRETASGDFTDQGALGTEVNTSGRDLDPFLKKDGLSLYYARETQSGNVGSLRGFVARRENHDSDWSRGEMLAGPVNDFQCRGFSVSGDGLTLFFDSVRPGSTGGSDIFMATRGDLQSDWGEVRNLGPSVNSEYDEILPYFSEVESRLYFGSDREGTLDVFFSEVSGGPGPGDCNGGGVSYSTDFEDSVLGGELVVGDYIQEDSGSYASSGDLDVEQIDGEVRISGSGRIDTLRVDGQTVGYTGKSVYLASRLEPDGLVVVESDVRIESYDAGGRHSGLSVDVFLDFDADNRILANLQDFRLGRIANVGRDEHNKFQRGVDAFAFQNGQSYRMRLEFDPSTGRAVELIDGMVRDEVTYSGRIGDFRAGFAVSVRFPGNSADVRFDNFGVSVDCSGEIDPSVDCNGNEIPDARDIESGASVDEDGDGIPDECQGVDCNDNGLNDAHDIETGTSSDVDANGVPDDCQSRVELVQSDPYCVLVRLTNDVGIRGGEIGLAFDSSLVRPRCAIPGPGFLGDGSDILCDLEPGIVCDFEDDVDAGMMIGWINDGVGSTLPPGTHDLLRICFTPVGARPDGVCSPLRFTSCLGISAAPTQNVVTSEDNESVPLAARDGEVCGVDSLFRRGDANSDGRFDITDPIVLLGCLFLGYECPECLDAADSDDDGILNVTDPVYLMNWRFLGGPDPLPPFLECGPDETADEFVGCVFDACP
jgi:hypothetical protein